jgi:hypothetical protein
MRRFTSTHQHIASCLALLAAACLYAATERDTLADSPGDDTFGNCGVHGHVFALNEEGHVTGVVPGARIELKNQAGQVVAQAGAGQDGYYKAHVSPGIYYYRVTAEGFEDEDVGRGIKLQLTEGYAPFDFSLTPGKTDPDKKPFQPTPVPIGVLTGMVLEQTDEGRLVAIPQATVSLRNDQANPSRVPVITRGPDREGKHAGEYHVTLQAGRWWALVSARGFETLEYERPIEIVANRRQNCNFILTRPKPEPPPKGQGIKGVVSLRGGEPRTDKPPEVKVSILPWRLADRRLARPVTLTPDARRNFQRDLHAGSYVVMARADGYRPARSGRRAVYAGRYTNVRLVLVPVTEERPREQLPLEVAVYRQTKDDVTPEEPLEGAEVLVRKEKDGTPISDEPRQITDVHGQVQLTIPEAGPYLVAAKKDGYHAQEVLVEVTGEGAKPTKLVLDPIEQPVVMEPGEPVREPGEPREEMAKLTVRVERPDGKPVQDAHVQVHSGEDVIIESPPRTDSDGIVSFPVPRRIYWLSATTDRGQYRPYYPSVNLRYGDAEATVVLHPRVAMEPEERVVMEPDERVGEADEPRQKVGPSQREIGPRTLDLEITTRDGRVLPGDTEVTLGLGHDAQETQRPTRGQCKFSHLERGTYWIVVTAQGYQEYREAFDLSERDVTSHPVVLHPLVVMQSEEPDEPPPMSTPGDEQPAAQTATLTVRVTMADRTDPRGANVVIRDAGDRLVASGSPDRGGIYSLPRRLPPGLYQIEVSKTGYAGGGGDVILAGRDQEQPFVLQPLRGREEPPVVGKPIQEGPGPGPPPVTFDGPTTSDQGMSRPPQRVPVELRAVENRPGGPGVPGAWFVVVPQRPLPGQPPHRQQADPGGVARFDLPPGGYEIQATGKWHRQQERDFLQIPIPDRRRPGLPPLVRKEVVMRRTTTGQTPGGSGQTPGGSGQTPGGSGQTPGGSGPPPPPERVPVEIRAVENRPGGPGVPGAYLQVVQVVDRGRRQTVHRQQVNEHGLASFSLGPGQYDIVATPSQRDKWHQAGQARLIVPAPDRGRPGPAPLVRQEVVMRGTAAGEKPGGSKPPPPPPPPPPEGTLIVVVVSQRNPPTPIDGATVSINGQDRGQTRGGRLRVEKLRVGQNYLVTVSMQHYKSQERTVHLGGRQVEAKFILMGGID